MAARRVAITGNTFPVKDALRALGGRWDANQKAWTVPAAKADEARQIVEKGEVAEPDERASVVLNDDRILGKVKYKNYTYLLLWEGMTKRGPAMKLCFADGSKIFWAEPDECAVIKRYNVRTTGSGRYARDEYMTFGRLRDLQESWKRKSPAEKEESRAISEAGGRCRCDDPLDEGDGTCMYCGYYIGS